VKSIALPSKGKSSKAFKVIESEDESPDGDSDEDLTKKMATKVRKTQEGGVELCSQKLFRSLR